MKTLLSSEGRKKLLRLIFGNPSEMVGVRAAARECGLSPASVSLFMKALGVEGVLKEGRPDFENPEVRALKILFNAERLHPAFLYLVEHFGVKGMGMYGNWTHGTNVEGEELDAWVLMKDIPEEKKAREIGVELAAIADVPAANVVFLTKERVEEIRGKKSMLYSALFNSFRIGGEGID
jgi:hypothetical protein